eukprot:6230097-Alexandrium_andersonii.AAC.1
MQEAARPSPRALLACRQPGRGGVDGAAVEGQPDGRAPQHQVLGRNLANATQWAAAGGVRCSRPVCGRGSRRIEAPQVKGACDPSSP